MHYFQLLIRNLLYHWRGNFAVFLGIALGSAVLTGALLVGDSLRGSLKALTLDQLGWVDEAMVPGRFFRADLANEIMSLPRAPDHLLAADHATPILLMQGSAATGNDDGATTRVRKVNVIGFDVFTFWEAQDLGGSSKENKELDLNRALAEALNAKVGDTVTLYLQKADKIPRESLMGNRKADELAEAIPLKVRKILPDEGMARFSLRPTPTSPLNAFVSLPFLQTRLDLEGRANAILVAGSKPTLQTHLQKHLTLDDWGLRYRSPKDRAEGFMRYLDPESRRDQLPKARWNGRLPDALADAAAKNGNLLTTDMTIAYYEKHRDYWSLESRSSILEPAVVRAVEKIAPRDSADGNFVPRWRWTPRLIYLADTLSEMKVSVPYAIVASDDTMTGPPGKEDYVLADDEIMLVKWPGFPFSAKPGGKIKLEYYAPDEKNNLEKKAAYFKVHSVVPLDGMLDDPDLTPEFPGITDKASMGDWQNPPFPYDPKRVKPVDEKYWERYRTTPKAYVNLKVAQKLWGTRFGDVTSIQVRLGTDDPAALPAALLGELKPEQGGFVFQPVREQALKASSGATDFGVLFALFSSFLIVSALLLVGLLVRLNLERRAGEIGLLLALGWDHGRVRRLLLGEGALLAVVGAAVGLVGAMFYADLMLKFLAANWPGGANLSFLRLHVEPVSLAIGYSGSLIVSVLTLYWATRVLSKLSPRALLSGETMQATGLASVKPGWSRWLIPGGVIGALTLAIMARFLPSQEAQAGSFFGSGALLLTACLAGVWTWLKRSSVTSSPQPTLSLLGMRNAGRHAARSLLTVGLLAAASFLIVAVESFHKDTGQEFAKKTGGSGGFALYAEGNLPIFEDLNDAAVRRRLDLDTPEMRRVVFYPCRVQAGDDASCLNLYKPLKPRVMGVADALIRRGGFHFGKTAAKTDAETANPWLLLQKKFDDAVPAFVDANTAQWILKVNLGDSVEIHDDNGHPVNLRIVGLLQESIFQSEILIGDANFRSLYPRQQGFAFQLIDTGDVDAETLDAVKQQIGAALGKSGFDVQTTASRLQGYLAVENTYLQTFQALGGLGLLLGAVGLAIVLLRGVWERRAELALLSALGFRSGQLAWLVLVENAYLLVLGLAAGTVSALLAVAPHLIGSGAHVLWLRIAALLTGVLAVGLVSAALAVWSTLKTPVLTALRRE